MKAIALFSNGLDSTLAVKLVQEQGVEVLAVNFTSPFWCCDGEGVCSKSVAVVAERLNVSLKLIGLGDEYFEVIRAPKYGYGKNLNPCIDCRILMLGKAHEYMKESGASFVFTGEVLQQRPMSQTRRAIDIIERESGLAGLILRPLSAKLFIPTIPEKKGWVDRERLLDISGRSRRRQLAMAEEWGVSGYFSPAGGCLLTDQIFACKLRDLMESKLMDSWSAGVLKHGRYHRLSDGFKLIVGRNHQENERLLGLARPECVLLEPVDKGPTALGVGVADDDLLAMAGRIYAYYFRKTDGPVDYRQKLPREKEGRRVTAVKAGESEVKKVRI